MNQALCQFCGQPAAARRGKYLRVAGQLVCGPCSRKSHDKIADFFAFLWKRARVGKTRRKQTITI
jgi:hypothetical protein